MTFFFVYYAQQIRILLSFIYCLTQLHGLDSEDLWEAIPSTIILQVKLSELTLCIHSFLCRTHNGNGDKNLRFINKTNNDNWHMDPDLRWLHLTIFQLHTYIHSNVCFEGNVLSFLNFKISEF